MNLSFLRRLAVQVLVVAVALIAVLTSGAPAQSLGDVARQEESRRKGTAAAGKVYTNDDLKGAPAAATTSPAQPAPSASTPPNTAPAPAPADGAKPPAAKAGDGAKTGDATAAPDKGDEAAWRKRRQDIQEALDRSKVFSDALQSRINGLSADFSARDDPAQRSVVAADRQKALTELERLKMEILKQTKDLADLQEEARKSGVPPGWLR